VPKVLKVQGDLKEALVLLVLQVIQVLRVLQDQKG
jgi:hypothetical protein